MAGGSFASDPSFDAYNQQVSPAMASYFQTMGQLERSRSRLMEVSQGVVGAVPGAFNMAQSGLARISAGMSYVGAGASAFHGQFLGAYNQYQGPMTGRHDFMGPGTAIAGLMGQHPFIQGRFQYEGSLIARDVAMQNFNMAVQDTARTLLTNVGPQAAMMAGFAVGGPLGAGLALVGGGASLMAPLALRRFGVDAQLHSERFRRQIQLNVGERLGDMGGANRFRLSRDAAAGASAAVTDYVSNVQRQYGWFAPEAREFEPLIQAAIATTSDKDLPKILESGAKGLKDRISALRDAAAVLNTNFEEIAQLATEFGEDSEMGVGGRFDQFVRDVNAAATRGRGLNRRALMQAGIQARDQAIAQGFQGEAAQRGLVSLAADIQERANLGLIRRDYLFAFGGRTQSEAAINTALATQQMERNMAMGPFGMMALGRMRGGGGMGGGLLGGAGQLGRAFMQDPFGFMLAPYDPQTRTRMSQDAPYEMFTRMQQTFGGGQFGQLAFLKTLQAETGMDDAQAMSQFLRIRGERRMLQGAFGDAGLSPDELMNAFMTARGVTPGLTIREFSAGNFSREQVRNLAAGNAAASVYLGAGTDVFPETVNWMSDEEIAVAAKRMEGTFSEARTRNRWRATSEYLPTILNLSRATSGAVDLYDFISGNTSERIERNARDLRNQREAQKASFAQAYGYSGTTRYLRANIENLKNIGVIQEGMGTEVGLAGQFLFGLYGESEQSRAAQERVLTYLEGEDPAKAKAFRTLLETIKTTTVGEGANQRLAFRLPVFSAGAATRVFEAMEQLSPENLAEALTAAGKEGALKDFGALQTAFESGGVSIEELKDTNVREQAKEFTRRIFSPGGDMAMLQQQRYFSAFNAGSLAQTFARAAAGIEQDAYANLARLRFSGEALKVKTMG